MFFNDDERNRNLRGQILQYFISSVMTDDERARLLGLPEGCRMRENAKIISPENFRCGKYVWIGEGAVLDASGRPATMRGVDLWASLLRPAGTKKLPTIVIASAYTREVFLLEFANLVQHDYNILAVDIRGTGSAGGEW
ncbi:MAG TPA: CocE/NonD family hydrolase, partial [Syntrophales bacterium]|nr:CocE/NonD family hydrolase [Syntrophales bacterium]